MKKLFQKLNKNISFYKSIPYSIIFASLSLTIALLAPNNSITESVFAILSFFLLSFVLFSIFLIIIVFGIKSGTKIILKLHPKGRQGFFNTFILLSVIAIAYLTNQRLVNLESRFGGREKLKCSQTKASQEVSSKVVRIIGSYSEGSGFPISKNEILTNFHVIDGEASPKVVFSDGSIETPTKIMGSKEKDFAVLSINREMEPLPFFGWLGTGQNYSNPSIGEPIFAFGYPEGSQIKGDPSVLKGSYSGKRNVDYFGMSMISSDISLVAGMSGGPLTDACGQVLGVNTLGIGGLSMFLDMESVQSSFNEISRNEVETLSIDTSTPMGVVQAFYSYIKVRNLEGAYDLINKDRIGSETLTQWKQGYKNTLQVDLILIKEDKKDKNKIWVKLSSQDWVDGGMVINFYEGYWTVKDLRLNESNIQKVPSPSWQWFYEWTSDTNTSTPQ